MICESDAEVSTSKTQPTIPFAVMPGPGLTSTRLEISDSIDWHESDPRELSIDPGKLSDAVALAQARGAIAQLCIIRHGKLVLQHNFGCDERSLFWIFSASKPYIAALIYVLADRGLLSLDDPISLHWPEFAGRGKGAITVRHVLQHRTGLSPVAFPFSELFSFVNWKRSVRRIENAERHWPAGAVPAYLPLDYGFILGELVHRITGKRVDKVLVTEILQRLDARDTYLGLPASEWRRHVPIVATGQRNFILQALINRIFTRQAVIPAAGISTTASDLARFYFMLLRSGSFDNARILSASVIEEARVPSSDGEMGRTANLYIRWSNGFQLGGPRVDPTSISPFGRLSSPRAFGHNGSNCCIGWADPDRDLVFAYLTNRLSNRNEAASHLAAVADAVLSACS
ncbi:MAG TPA: serine hydrolase domain-containing protein [Terracidiphilus sp.]|jgi:CubicO group peptidase (beta-lactamase class C family)